MERRLYALVLEDSDFDLLRRLLSEARRGEIQIRGIVVFVEATPQKVGGYSKRGVAVYRVEQFTLSLALGLVRV